MRAVKRKPRTHRPTPPQSLAEYLDRDGAPTQDALAKRLDITPAYVSLIRAGKRQPSLALALRIQDLTGVPASALVTPEAVAS